MEEQKKVLFVATVVKMHINVFHLPYLKWFREQGYETHVGAKNDFNGEELEIRNCDKYYNIPFDRNPISINNIRAYKKLKYIIENNNYEIIHCNTPIASIITRIAAANSRKKRTKVIYTAHGFHFFKNAPIKNWLIYYPIEKIGSYITDAIITINKEDYTLAKNKMKAKKIYYVPGVGVDTKKFVKQNIDKDTFIKSLDIPNDKLIILSVGEINSNKNHEVIIEAISKVKNSNIHYCIAGKGKLEKYLKDKAKSLGIEDKVHFLGFRKDITKLCNISDIFCFPSKREGLPLSVLEAMACELPIICSNIRGNSDLVEDGVGGKLCDPNSVKDFANAIELLAQNKELRLKMGDYNRHKAMEFDLNKIILNMEEIYKEVLDE